jgi:hypothetical protein
MVLSVHSEHGKCFASHIGVANTSCFYYGADMFTLEMEKFQWLLNSPHTITVLLQLSLHKNISIYSAPLHHD